MSVLESVLIKSVDMVGVEYVVTHVRSIGSINSISVDRCVGYGEAVDRAYKSFKLVSEPFEVRCVNGVTEFRRVCEQRDNLLS